MTNLFKVRRDGSGDIAVSSPIPTRLTRGEAFNLAVWLVAFADAKAASGNSEFAVMLQGALNPRKLVSADGPGTTAYSTSRERSKIPTRRRTAEASIEVARPLSALLSSGHPATSPLAGLHRLVHPPNISYNIAILTAWQVRSVYFILHRGLTTT